MKTPMGMPSGTPPAPAPSPAAPQSPRQAPPGPLQTTKSMPAGGATPPIWMPQSPPQLQLPGNDLHIFGPGATPSGPAKPTPTGGYTPPTWLPPLPHEMPGNDLHVFGPMAGPASKPMPTGGYTPPTIPGMPTAQVPAPFDHQARYDQIAGQLFPPPASPMGATPIGMPPMQPAMPQQPRFPNQPAPLMPDWMNGRR